MSSSSTLFLGCIIGEDGTEYDVGRGEENDIDDDDEEEEGEEEEEEEEE